MATESPARLLRLLFQARYEPVLTYFTLADRAAASFKGDYPQWHRGGNADIRLSNYADRCVLAINHLAFSYSQDSSDRDVATKRLQRIVRELPPALELGGYTRLGLRHLVLVPVQMSFESLVAVMAAKLYVDAKPLRIALPHKTDDLLYRLDSSEEDRKFHVSIAPVRREEIGGKIIDLAAAGTINAKEMQETIRETEAGYPSVAVFFDVDLYKAAKRIGLDAASGFIEDAGNRIDRMVRHTTDYLLDKTVEPR